MKFPQRGKQCDEFDRAVCGVLNKNATSHRCAMSVSCNDAGYWELAHWNCGWVQSLFQGELARLVIGIAM